MNYVFVFGRDPELSFAELVSYLENKNISFKLVSYKKNYALLSLKQLNLKKIIDDLGGTVKIGVILENFNDLYTGSENKIKYSLSIYENNDIKKIRQSLKSYFKENRLKAFYHPPKRDKILMPSEVITQDLLVGGFELLVFSNFVVKTLAVSNPLDLEQRDKPINDFLKTTSRRLAKILINLAQPKKTLLDPFCGYGIILQEALLLGYDVVGVDNDKKSITTSKKFLVSYPENFTLINADSTKLSDFLKQNIDSIATEPYLGPFLKKKPASKQAEVIVKELEPLYLNFLREAKKVLPKNSRIAIVLPKFKTKEKTISINLKSIIKDLNLKIPKFPKITVPITYPTKVISREIWVLEV